jgi:predicted ATPase
LAYRRYLGHTIPTSLLDACDEFRYDKVFFFPAWGDIYQQDDVRTETFTEAMAIGNAIKTTYELLGYDVITVPKATAQQRVNFIMSKI